MVPMVYTKKFSIVRVKGPVHSFIHSFFTVVTLECALKLHLANIDMDITMNVMKEMKSLNL